MIIEHFESTKKTSYNEDTGIFTIKNNSWLGIFNLTDTHISEKDISITKINELKELADGTTLTSYDIAMLFDFAKLKFNYNGNVNQFVNTPLKDIFPSDNTLTINKLMILAYDTLHGLNI